VIGEEKETEKEGWRRSGGDAVGVERKTEGAERKKKKRKKKGRRRRRRKLNGEEGEKKEEKRERKKGEEKICPRGEARDFPKGCRSLFLLFKFKLSYKNKKSKGDN
jgi:hypothetical protein